MMSPQAAAKAFYDRVHAKEPRAWELVRALQTMAANGSQKAQYALNLIKAEHKLHMQTVHNVIDVKPEDGRPTVGYYPFPTSCSAGVCGGYADTTQTGASMGLTPDVIEFLRKNLLIAASSQPPAALPGVSTNRLPTNLLMQLNMVKAKLPAPAKGPASARSSASQSVKAPMNLARAVNASTKAAPAPKPGTPSILSPLFKH